VCFAKDISSHNIQYLKKFFDVIVPTDEDITTAHLAIFNWLVSRQNEYEYVLQSDLRDVILQKNPFEYLSLNPNYDLFYVCEGMSISENNCNMFWHNEFRQNIRFHNDIYSDSQIINGGIVCGKVKEYCNHLFNIFTNTNRIHRTQINDQQVMSYMYKYLKSNPRIKYCHPYTSEFCATGEAIKWGNIKVNFDGKQVLNQENQPYYIFHQWDRTEYADAIRNNFKNTLSFTI